MTTKHLLFVLLLLHAAAPAIAQQALGIGPLESAGGLRAQKGVPIVLVCPASDGSKATLYGTDVYTDDSPICAAAIHAGVLKAGVAGAVTIMPGDGAESFQASERNGIQSHAYGRWDHSYEFVRDDVPGDIALTTVWKGVPFDYSEPITVRCPPGTSTRGLLWGTDIYTGDSSICLAAVHAGVIAAETGGTLTVMRAPEQEGYPASEQNGVESRYWGRFRDAFTVTAAREAALPPERATVLARSGRMPDLQGAPDQTGGTDSTPPDEGGDPLPTAPGGPQAPVVDPHCTTASGMPALCVTVAGWSGAGAGYVMPPAAMDMPPDADPDGAPPGPQPLSVTVAGWSGAGAGYVVPPPPPDVPPDADPAAPPAGPPALAVTLVGWSGAGAGYVVPPPPPDIYPEGETELEENTDE